MTQDELPSVLQGAEIPECFRAAPSLWGRAGGEAAVVSGGGPKVRPAGPRSPQANLRVQYTQSISATFDEDFDDDWDDDDD